MNLVAQRLKGNPLCQDSCRLENMKRSMLIINCPLLLDHDTMFNSDLGKVSKPVHKKTSPKTGGVIKGCYVIYWKGYSPLPCVQPFGLPLVVTKIDWINFEHHALCDGPKGELHGCSE